MTKYAFRLIASCICCVLLGACGGGGDPNAPTPVPPVEDELTWDDDNWDEKDWQ